MSGHFRNACLGQHQGHQSRWNSRTHVLIVKPENESYLHPGSYSRYKKKTSQLKDPSSKYHPSHPKCSSQKGITKFNQIDAPTHILQVQYIIYDVFFLNIFGLTHVRPTAPPDVMMSKNLNLNLYDWVSDWLVELHGVSNAGSLQLPG